MILKRLVNRRPAVLPIVALAALAAVSLAGPAAAKERGKQEKKDPYAVTKREPGKPVLAVVSLDDQRVTVYDADGAVLRAPVSSGQSGLETPVGIYSVLQKEAEHYSNVYDDAAMPHMQRITWSGIALHGGALPGYPASHGCVRMPYKFAKQLFGLTNLGLRVVVARDDVAPVAISHPLLFKRTPYHAGSGLVSKAAALVGIGGSQPGDEPPDVAERASALQKIVDVKSAEAETIAKEADPARAEAKKLAPDMKRSKKALSRAEKAVERAAESVAYAAKVLDRAKSENSRKRAEARKAKADAKLAEAQKKRDDVKAKVGPKIDAYEQADTAAKALEEKRDAALAEARAAKRKLKPVSVFISRATGKLYVRQDFEAIFESPVTIRDPDRPIGTYTYTAVDYGEDGRDMRWNVVAVSDGKGRARSDYYDDRYDTYDDYDDYDDYGRRRKRRHKPQTKKNATVTDAAAASAALDRITIPPDVVERISKLVLPGASLIVSDEAAHKETGQQTDFIVLISGEPQGGIKKRPKRDPYYDDYFGNGDYYDGYSRRGRRRQQYRGPFFSFW